MKTKYKYDIDDEVIILLGAPGWYSGVGPPFGISVMHREDYGLDLVDMRPDLVGKKATIVSREPSATNKPMYWLDIEGVGRMAWFKEPQIKTKDELLSHQNKEAT